MRKYTPSQIKAIDSKGTNIIVSAGAGSGKTAVLTERVYRHVLDGIDIDKMLILTFTNAAAKEMKDRIRKKLLKDTTLDKDKLNRQLNKIDSSYIMTFDAYALNLVKKYHLDLNIDSNVNIIDTNILNTKLNEYINDILLENYRTKDPKFTRLINELCIKDDEKIRDTIKNLYFKLSLLLDIDEYIFEQSSKANDEKYLNELFNDYNNILLAKINGINELVNEFSNYVDDYHYYFSIVDELKDTKNYDDIRSILSTYDKVPVIKKTDSSEESKKLKDRINKDIKALKELVVSSKQDLINELLLTSDNSLVLLSLTKELINRINKYKYLNNTFEYNDIFKMAIKLVNNEDIKNEIKDYFDEILIDEYQDTSDLQDIFISLIAKDNVYMVGDIKQSIYQFRNANPRLFLNKYSKYENNDGGIAITLPDNFRSRSEVLEGINKIFDRIMDINIGGADYLKKHHMLSSFLPYQTTLKTSLNSNLEILNYDVDSELIKDYTKQEVEAFTIGKDIKDKINSKYLIADGDSLREARYSDFAILIDRSTDFDTFKEILTYLNIPSTIVIEEKMNDSDLLSVIKAIFNYLVCIHNDDYGRDFKLSYISLARSFVSNMNDADIYKVFTDESFENTALNKSLLKISENIDYKSISNILDEIIKEFNIYANLIKIGELSENNIKLDYLYKLAHNLNELGYSYIEFSEYLNNIEDDNPIKFNVERSDEDAVKIMTIHKSKGLEFPICYYPLLTKKFNESDIKDSISFFKDLGVVMPAYIEQKGLKDTLKKELFKYSYEKDEISEKIRLFYVALTRAKEKIIIVSPIKDNSKKKGLIDDNDRLAINSFSDILDLVYDDLKDYVNDVDLDSINISSKYKYPKLDIFNDIERSGNLIELKKSKVIQPSLIETSSYSKKTGMLDKDVATKLELGTKIHKYLELLDFNNPSFEYVEDKYIGLLKKFLSCELLKDIAKAKIYKEYEFIFNDSKGVIDLLLEYEDHIDIVDYKSKHIDDESYINQLKGYKEYIQTISDKPINCYLYSIVDGNYKEVK